MKWSLAISSENGRLDANKMLTGDESVWTFGQSLMLGKAWRIVEARLKASSPTFRLKVEEPAGLGLEESVRT